MDDTEVISLRDYLAVLRRQRWIVLLVTVLVVVAALAFSFAQTPIYESETELVVDPVRQSAEADLERLLSPGDAQVETERRVITSRPVAERAAEALDVDDTRELLRDVDVQSVPDTRVVRVIARDPDPEAAAATSDALAAAYLDHRREEAVEQLLAGQRDVEQRAAQLREELAQLDDTAETGDDIEIELDDEGEPVGDIDAGADDEVERQILLAQLTQVLAQAGELGEAADAITGGGSILSPAEVSTSPISPQPVRTGALAVVLGLLLGVGLAFLRDHLDDVVRDESDFKRATANRPVLGRIPVWDDPEGGRRLATVVAPSSPASEAYRELSSAVRFLLVAQAPGADAAERTLADGAYGKSVVVSSAVAGDGKTSTAANLAVATARIGLKTLLVDTDLRKPTVDSRFGLGKVAGLSDLLLSGGSVDDHVVPVGVDNLLVMPAGTLPPNPHELLASPAMRNLGHELVAQADLVIYDTPAVLAVPDALELGRHVDLAVLVGRAGTTGRRQLSAAIERLEQVGTHVAGTVLNGIDPKGEGYYYGYYYVEAGTDAADQGQEAVGDEEPAGSQRARRGSTSRQTAPRPAPRPEPGAVRVQPSSSAGSTPSAGPARPPQWRSATPPDSGFAAPAPDGARPSSGAPAPADSPSQPREGDPSEPYSPPARGHEDDTESDEDLLFRRW